jgi:hypothetical protein
VRPIRWLYGQTDNGVPSVSYGPWSPIYTSYNPPFATGPLTAVSTVSNVVSDATQTATHEITPAFIYRGNTSMWNTPAELYRVEVFTDEDCINPVFIGALNGAPAYVPRPIGPLGMPTDVSGVTAARTIFLQNGNEPTSMTADGIETKTNELDKGTPPTENHTGLPPGQVVTGAKVDLWDSSWSGGRYYWTVMPVNIVAQDDVTTTLTLPAFGGDTTINVVDSTGIVPGDAIRIGTPGELAVVKTVAGSVITLSSGLGAAHLPGELVDRMGGGVTYTDAELTQDSCASGRRLSFAKESDPVVTGEKAPYVSGLSPNGKLVAASKSAPHFYGQPLVAWQTVPGADQYEAQWSRKAYPWKTAGSQFTWGSSLTLPLSPGTWYYRVRGLDFGMIGSKQQMSWSDPVRLVVTKPRFRVVHH